ncbi:MAG TPA: hypothetical protein VJX92_07050 [Methylomirabilota bacterium]|nr:hypothetical protein [Methylomirabilota bacterium]
MPTDTSIDTLNPFFAKTVDGSPETYFSLWTITDEGRRDPGKVQEALLLASKGLKEIGGRCRLYVTMGGPADLVGVAKPRGDQLDEASMLALQTAIQASGVLKAVFFKALEFTADGYAAHTEQINNLSRP